MVLVLAVESPASAEVEQVRAVSSEVRAPFDFPIHDIGPWPEGLSLRREDLYDDWGR